MAIYYFPHFNCFPKWPHLWLHKCVLLVVSSWCSLWSEKSCELLFRATIASIASSPTRSGLLSRIRSARLSTLAVVVLPIRTLMSGSSNAFAEACCTGWFELVDLLLLSTELALDVSIRSSTVESFNEDDDIEDTDDSQPSEENKDSGITETRVNGCGSPSPPIARALVDAVLLFEEHDMAPQYRIRIELHVCLLWSHLLIW